jgi:hypothetical protein
MPALFNYNVFVSHAWTYSEDYKRFIQFLDNANNFSYKNYSIPVSDAFGRMTSAQLGEAIKGQIRPTSVVIILGGIYVSHSDWIQYEIDVAVQLGKPILGVLPWGQERMPAAMKMNASKIVGWNSPVIVQAIRDIVK